jgi:hypothetical protein
MSDHEKYGSEDEAFGDDMELEDLEDENGDVDIVDDDDEDQTTGAFG